MYPTINGSVSETVPNLNSQVESNILMGFIILLLSLIIMGFLFVRFAQDYRSNSSQESGDNIPQTQQFYV